MENMTELTRKMYDTALNVRSVAQAAQILRENGSFRSFGDILRYFTGSENPKEQLVDGLMAVTPGANRESVDKKVRNWLGGRTQSVSKQDAFLLCLVLGLNLEQADEFLKQVTGEGIHWRSAEEICWGYALANGLSYERTCALLEKAKTGEKKRKTEPNPEAYTADVKQKIQPLLYGGEDALLAYLSENRSSLGAYHNTAYSLFMEYMAVLEGAEANDFIEDGPKMTSRYILENYLYRNQVPVAKRAEAKSKTAFSAIQRSIRANWPDEVTVSKMKSRELDVSRKVLMLLFLAVDTGEEEDDEDAYYNEGMLTQDEIFEGIYTRLNKMLKACGFQMLDPRSPFDWMVLYSICTGDLLDADMRMEKMLEQIFHVGTENQ